MEKVYSRLEVINIIGKSFLDGKINFATYFLRYIEHEIETLKNDIEYTNENGFFRNERWIECNSSLQTLHKAHFEISETITILEKMKTET